MRGDVVLLWFFGKKVEKCEFLYTNQIYNI